MNQSNEFRSETEEHMSESQTPNASSKASKNLLPWILAGVFLVIYLGTVNRWVNLLNLVQISKIAQWDWKPAMMEPVNFLVTLPFRGLADDSIAIALNIVNAVLGALTIGLLGRAIQLLPQNRTHEQRVRSQDDSGAGILQAPNSWIPVVLGATAFGLQLSFWEHATSFTGEMVNLFLFAYIVRGILEFRAQRPQTTSWLYKVCFAFGLAITNNWGMFGFFPIFVAALISVLGLRFFSVKLLLMMAGCGVAGLAFYLVAPLSASMVFEVQDSFGELLTTYMGTQRSNFGGFPKYILLICGLTSLSPLLFLSIKWPSSTGEANAAGSKLSQFLFHLIHLLFLAVCLVVVFDPAFSPRELSKSAPLLTLYFLGALCIGYFAGYCVLVFSPDQRPQPSWKRSSPLKKALDGLMPWVLLLLVVGVPAGLIYKNVGFVTARNAGLLKMYADKLKSDLGEGPQTIFSEDSLTLILLESVLDEEPTDQQSKLLVHHQLMAFPEYQAIASQRYGDRWVELSEEALSVEPINPLILNQQFQALVGAAPAHFLHLMLDYRFEQFTPNLNGLSYEIINNRPDFSRNAEPENVASSDKNWKDMRDDIDRLALYCEKEIPEAMIVGNYFSAALNALGVEMQKLNELQAAATYFFWALELNPDNQSADLNLQFNEVLNLGMELDKLQEDSVKVFNSFNRAQLMMVNGPVDEIHYRTLLGKNLANTEVGMLRQAIPQFQRALDLQPNNYQALAGMLQVMLQAGDMEKATELLTQLKSSFSSEEDTTLGQRQELFELEAWLLLGLKQYAEAESLLNSALEEFPRNSKFLDALYNTYNASGQHQKALNVATRQLEVDSKNAQALLNQATSHILMEQYDQAIAPLDQALTISTNRLAFINRTARINKAIALLRGGKLESARDEYLKLKEDLPTLHKIDYGLAQVYDQLGNVEEALQSYQAYFSKAPANLRQSEEFKQAQIRAQELAGGNSP